MQIGNVVRWSDRLWIVSEWTEGIMDKPYTKRGHLTSFSHANLSAHLTNKSKTDFSTDDVKRIAPNAEEFVMRNLKKAVLG